MSQQHIIYGIHGMGKRQDNVSFGGEGEGGCSKIKSKGKVPKCKQTNTLYLSHLFLKQPLLAPFLEFFHQLTFHLLFGYFNLEVCEKNELKISPCCTVVWGKKLTLCLISSSISCFLISSIASTRFFISNSTRF